MSDEIWFEVPVLQPDPNDLELMSLRLAPSRKSNPDKILTEDSLGKENESQDFTQGHHAK